MNQFAKHMEPFSFPETMRVGGFRSDHALEIFDDNPHVRAVLHPTAMAEWDGWSKALLYVREADAQKFAEHLALPFEAAQFCAKEKLAETSGVKVFELAKRPYDDNALRAIARTYVVSLQEAGVL